MSTFEEALMSLQLQSAERGFGGDLTDVSVTLCEDHKTISLWSHYHLDPPLTSSFDLPHPIDEREFDPLPYVRRLLHEDTRAFLRRAGLIPDTRA